MSRPTNGWMRREGRLGDRWWRGTAYLDDRFPDGTKLEPHEDPGDLSDAFWLWVTDIDERGHLVMRINPEAVPGAGDLWWVAMEDRDGDGRDVVSLVAFDTGHHPDGTVITNAEFVPMKVRSDEQAGAVRWWRDDALIDQVYVRSDIRRSHVGLKIVYAVTAYHQANGWPGKIHSDGRRTDLGERFVSNIPLPQRIHEWAQRMPPMDPGTDAGPR